MARARGALPRGLAAVGLRPHGRRPSTKARGMYFENTTIDKIKSPSQRALATYWDSLAKDRLFPDFFDFKPEEHIHDAGQLVVWKVEREESRRRFRALYQGGKISKAVNFAWAGKTMDEVIPEYIRDFALDAANACALSGCVVYSVFSTWDTRGRRVDCERVLLPFGHGDVMVEQIVASLQLTSPQGDFDPHNILDRFELRAQSTFTGKIRSGFARDKLGSLRPVAIA
jgi:hypothetical protein